MPMHKLKMTLDGLATAILDSACPNGGGENSYYIETHCVGWNVTAQKINGRWEIIDVVSEDC